MIPVEDSGSGGITNWAAVSVDDMFRYVSRNLEPHWRQAEGWQKTNELMWLHADRLNRYLEHLARVWNPDTSPASQAYREKLNELVVSVKNVQDVAGENVTYANDIPRSLGETFAKMQPVYQMYVFERSRPTSSPADEAARRAHMLMLETQARAIMYALGAALNSSGSRFQEPKPYQAPRSIDDSTEYPNNSNNTHTLPIIPPVATQQPTQTQTPPGQVRPITTTTGPDLSGLNPQQPVPTGATGPTPGPGTGPTPGGPSPYPGMPPGGVIGGGPGGPGGAPRPTTPGGIVGGPAGARGAGMPPGGVIGGAAGGARGAGGVGGVRPNPPGGVIGGGTPRGPMGTGTAGARPGTAGAGTAGRGAVGGPLGGVHGGRSGDEDGEQFDPDTQWSVSEGVAPVVDTPETPDQIDPGPAIGLNR